MIKIALVGNIASGKSTVEEFLKDDGYKVLDTDIVCHEILKKSSAVVRRFKDYDVFDGEQISRVKLGQVVFNDDNLKLQLENIIYPELIQKINEFFISNSSEQIVFVAVPLLFEAGMENLFDKTIFVYCDDEIRLKRLIVRNGYTKDYAEKRMSSQMSQDLKIKKSDYVVYNNATKDILKEQVFKLIEQIR